MTERRSGLVTRDSKTGLRRNGIRYLDGNPPTPAGCRWCGTREYWHGRRYVASVGWHTWTMPTIKQMLARMEARRKAAAIKRESINADREAIMVKARERRERRNRINVQCDTMETR